MIETVTIGNATLYLGDCREILPSLVAIDAVVTDPPYGIGYVKGAGGRRVAGTRLPPRRNIEAIVGDDRPFDPELFLKYPEVILWGANHFSKRLTEGGRWLAWDKLAGSTLSDSFSDVEYAWHSEAGAARIFSYLWKGVLQDGEKGARREHPTQKPIALMQWCVTLLKGRAATVLDPFMGSGTTGVACIKLNRHFVGVEIEPKYFEVACRRVAEAVDQPNMFAERPKPAVQEVLSLVQAKA